MKSLYSGSKSNAKFTYYPMKWLLARILVLILCAGIIACQKDTDPLDDPPIITDTLEGYQQYGTPFGEIPETEDILMYEINLRAFSSGGDLQGVIDRLDALKAMSINVIWLMPIHPIGQINSVNSPYSVKDYLAVSEEYGSLDDLRALTDAAHARGMAVIMDWVANHTAWDNPWITNKDWYTQDGSGNIVHPPGTNWQDVADLNFGNDSMRLAMIDAMKYWILEANVDGYRCDYADGVPRDFWAQALGALNALPDRDLVFLAEGSRSDHFTAGFDLNFGWNFYSTLKNVFSGQSANQLYTTHNSEYAGIPAGKHKLRFSTNHDESAWDQTPMVLFKGKQGALAASVLTVYVGGVPMIFTGQETGRTSKVPFFTKSPIDWGANPDMQQAYRDLLTFYSVYAPARKGTNRFFTHPDVFCFTKTYQEETLLILVNTRNQNITYTLPAELKNTQWKDAFSGEPVDLQTAIDLGPFQYLILK